MKISFVNDSIWKISWGFIFANRLKCKNYAGFFCLVSPKQYNALNNDNISFNKNNPGTRGIFLGQFGEQILTYIVLKAIDRSCRKIIF